MRVHARGAVQGVGFRPFVFRLAQELDLRGFVLNSPQGAMIEVEGFSSDTGCFLSRLRSELPSPAFLTGLESSVLDPVGYRKFEILKSEASGVRTAYVLPDIATCPECMQEVRDPNDRRYRYPFTNCTRCGPRYSIVRGLPYDRPNTSMRGFAMCRACLREYEDPHDRRFHAQPTACPDCGPQLEFWTSAGKVLARGDYALAQAAERIRMGEIVAVKGIGGFHLMVDARNEGAVHRLRDRKRREAKPMAVMVPNLEAARQCAWLDPLEEGLLTSPEAPIVLALARLSEIAPSVAPENPNLGVMLPYSPLHHLLLDELGFAVVATSGNLSEEPICIDEREALSRFAGIADCLLVHNRPIVRPIDDSVARVMAGRAVVLRRARGYAPLPIPLEGAKAGVLGVGAHLKNAVALSIAGSVVVSPHVGDLDNLSTRQRMEEEAKSLVRLYEARPSCIAHDLHPDYASTRFAESLETSHAPVQHHVAHAAACLGENELKEPALVVSWDGTGYGADGSVWGGEFFVVDRQEVRRVGCLKPFVLPGGELAVKEGRRSALGAVYTAFGEEGLGWLSHWIHRAFEPQETRGVLSMLRTGLRCVPTTSAGRLFDACAALGADINVSRFEGDAAMRFEALALGIEGVPYPFAIAERDGTIELDWTPALAELLRDLSKSLSPSTISARFHEGLAEGIVGVAMKVGLLPVALTGGCFQNRRLLEDTWARLEAVGHRPYSHQRLPPNDGGIAFGQVVCVLRGMRLT
ncbi:MAG TPA: carbamoyltransferase HypF [Fimbriimonas sp.]